MDSTIACGAVRTSSNLVQEILYDMRPHLTNWLGGNSLKVEERVRISLGL